MNWDRFLIVAPNLISTWPFVSLILGVVALILFRKPLSGLINRLRKAGPWLEAAPPETQQSLQKLDETVQDLMNFGSSPAVLYRERLIKEDIETRQIANAGEKLVNILVRQLAVTRLALSCEQIYNIIFGSQIHLLRAINNAGTSGLPMNSVVGHFEHVAQLFPALQTFTIKGYLGYLFDANLMTAQNDVCYIMPDGTEFLVWACPNRPFRECQAPASGHTEMQRFRTGVYAADASHSLD